MATAVSAGQLGAADRAESRFRTGAALLVALCCCAYILGVTWDIQWHTDVGPDTFWTKSHLFFYAGAALSGLICLLVALRTTLRFRQGAPAVTAATTTPWLGVFRAPIGFLVSGLGALSFLLSGLFDLWWHEVFGFDITLLSPPHFGLLFSGVVISVGLIYAFASEANRAADRGEGGLLQPAALGALFGVAVLLTQFSLFLQVPLEMFTFAGPVIVYPVVVSLVFGIGLMAAASFLERPGAATVTALFYLLIRWGLLYAVGPLVRWEAALEQLAYREGYLGRIFPAVVPFIAPALIFAAGLVIDAGLLAARRYRLRGRPVIWGVAAAAFVVNTLVDRRWSVYYGIMEKAYPEHAEHIGHLMEHLAGALVPTLIACAVAGALAGWIGWNAGISLRTTRQ